MQNSQQIRNGWLTNFCDSLKIFISIVMIQIVVVIYSFSYISFDMEYLRKLSILTLLSQLVGLVLLIIMCKMRYFFNKLNVFAGVVILIILVVVITSILAQIIGHLDLQLAFHLFENVTEINLLNFKLSFATVLVTLTLVRYFYIQDQWYQQINKLSEARLNALQARIKPHFLFNSLNSITALISIDAELAEKAITDFAQLMRRTFTFKDKYISLREELKWVEQYLSIEKLRMGERLGCAINCSNDILDCKIPVLCLQPLVENSVIHGIAPLENGGCITIKASQQNNNLVIEVSNPYRQDTNTQSNGMALRNITERLQLQYGNKAELKVNPKDNTYTVIMSIPV